jgi:hypothetical protein
MDFFPGPQIIGRERVEIFRKKTKTTHRNMPDGRES